MQHFGMRPIYKYAPLTLGLSDSEFRYFSFELDVKYVSLHPSNHTQSLCLVEHNIYSNL